MLRKTIDILTVASLVTGFMFFSMHADAALIGNESSLGGWESTRARVLVRNDSPPPIFATLALDEDFGPSSSSAITNFQDSGKGLAGASVKVDPYFIQADLTAQGADQELRVVGNSRDELYVETGTGEGAILNFEFNVTLSAILDLTTEPDSLTGFQLTLGWTDSFGTFHLLDDTRETFADGSGAPLVGDFIDVAVVLSTNGLDDFLVGSGTFLPLTVTAVGIAKGIATVDFSNTIQLTGLTVTNERGELLEATIGSSLDPNNPIINRSMAMPEPATLALLGIGVAGIGYQRRKRFTA